MCHSEDEEITETVVEEKLGKKKGGRAKKEIQPGEDPTPLPTVWFGTKKKLNGRPQARINESTGEIDVLSLALHSGISSDEDLTAFMNEDVLNELEEVMKTAAAHNKKVVVNENGTLITRYFTEDTQLPKVKDPRVDYKPSLDKYPRWVVRTDLMLVLCCLLDDRQRQSCHQGTRSGYMVSFRGVRRDLPTIYLPEIESAEREVFISQSIVLTREILYIRKVLFKNAGETIQGLVAKNTGSEDALTRQQYEFNVKMDQYNKERGTMTAEILDLRASCARDLSTEKKFSVLASEESLARIALHTECFENILHTTRRLATALARQRIAAKPVVVAPEPRLPDDIESLRTELEDARLEIARLKDDARGKAVPKPKAHRKFKDPDIHLATETDIKSSVRAHMSMGGSSSRGGTPMSGISSVITRATRRVGVAAPGSQSMAEIRQKEEQEFEVARRLKTLSRSRELDLCNAESASEQLAEVIEALSSNLTRVSLTIDDVAIRRTAILNHMRSLAMNSRGIISIIRERPYLLSLARRMNHERRPVVQLNPLRALINVSAANLKALQEIEKITLESVGGTFDVMSLEEAAAAALQDDEEWMGETELEPPTMTPRPEAPLLYRSSPRGHQVLTRTTLIHHDQMTSTAPLRTGKAASIDSS